MSKRNSKEWLTKRAAVNHRKRFMASDTERATKHRTMIDFQLACGNAENIGYIGALRKLQPRTRAYVGYGNGTGTSQAAYSIEFAAAPDAPEEPRR